MTSDYEWKTIKVMDENEGRIWGKLVNEERLDVKE